MTDLNLAYKHMNYALSFNLYGKPTALFSEYVARREQWERDRMFQDMNNNLWDNHPGELDRWADDGGR